MIYLASPYSHPDPAVREARYQAVCWYAAHLIEQGHLVFSPIAHSHGIVQYGLRGDWESWEQFDCAMLLHPAITELRILRLPGWEKSVGIAGERAQAAGRGLLITYGDLLLPVWARAYPKESIPGFDSSNSAEPKGEQDG